ncbi:MAG TPA: zinc ribbon domain-containing protein [Nitrospira sp.]|nr:zinc ribbon domain-containing protein [Nitrospira sp.]
MPIYEYRCGRCEKTFEATQSVHARVEDTVCPFCQAQEATRLISSVSSKVIGTHKPTFSELKAYDQLNQRMDKFSKLPPLMGKRDSPPLNMTSDSNPTPGQSAGT